MVETVGIPRYVDFSGPRRTAVTLRGKEQPIDFADWEQVTDGVRCRTWKFKDIDESICDGALVEIQPGRRTPVQYVKSDTTFCEVPLSGKLLFLSLSPAGKMSIEKFDSQENKGSIMFEMKKGSIMCWHAPENQRYPAEFLEFEEPGFKVSELPTVKSGAKEIDGHPIPPVFWAAVNFLDKSI